MSRRVFRLLSLLLLLPAPPAGAQVITTIAGGGPDGLPAASSNLFDPSAVVQDAAGNLYVAGRGQERIFKVDPSGRLTVFAGTGVRGFSGDGGPAAAASFDGINDLALDAAGDLHVADTGRVMADEMGRLFVGGNFRIRKIDASNGVINTVAVVGALDRLIEGIAFDRAGDLYLSDSFGHRVHRLQLGTGNLTTVAGTGSGAGPAGDHGPATSASLIEPKGLSFDAAGNLYIAEFGRSRVRRVDAATGIITTYAGGGAAVPGDGGPATLAQVGLPSDVLVAPDGGLLIAQGFPGRVRRVDAASGIITTVAGGGTASPGDGDPATLAVLRRPVGLGVDSREDLLIADALDHRLRKVDAATGFIGTAAGTGVAGYNGEGGPAAAASLQQPTHVALDAGDNVIISDTGNSALRRVHRVTGLITTLAPSPAGPAGSFPPPGPLAADAAGNVFFVQGGTDPDVTDLRVLRLDALSGAITTAAGGGGLLGRDAEGEPATSVLLLTPAGVALDRAGNLFISEFLYGRISRVDAATGILTTVAGNYGAEFAGDGGPATEAAIGRPLHVTLDGSDNLYLHAPGHGRVRRVDAATGIITTVAGNGSSSVTGDGGPATQAGIGGLAGLCADAEGSLYLSGSNRIRKVDAATGIITTIAGDGVGSYEGDGGPAPAARFAGVRGIAVNGFGSLLAADAAAHRVRKVSACASDAAPPRISVSLSPAVIGPANHRLAPVTATVEAADDCGRPRIRLVSVVSSDPDDAPGPSDGHTTDDVQGADAGTADFEFLLRAELSRDGEARTYTATYTAEDEAGHETLASSAVTVRRRGTFRDVVPRP